MTEITPQFLEPYFYNGKTHIAYKKCCEMYDALRIHANGEYPAKLIDERRPSESEPIKDYRKKIYIPVTKDVPSRMIASFGKIRRSEDWYVSFPEEVPPSIATEETPQKYFEEKFPYFNSVTNWSFSVLLRSILLDANALILVLPVNKELEANEYLKPYPYIFHSPDVIDYIPNDYAILKVQAETEDKNYLPQNNRPAKYLIVTNKSVQTYLPDQDGKYYLANDYQHGLGYMPIADVQAIYLKSYGLRPIFESQIYSIVPRLDEAAREYSDLQAEVVQHVHSESEEYGGYDCGNCADKNTGISTGWVDGKKGKVVCPKCKGSRKVSTSPYSQRVTRSAKLNMGEQPTPFPSKVYIQKQIEIVRIQDERIDKHLFMALASKNMQFLMQTPLNVSGEAKSIDKDELNNTVHAVAEDLISIMDRVIAISIDYRYSKVIQSAQERKLLRPFINVPEHFDLLGSQYLIEELQKAKAGSANSAIIFGLEKEYIKKKFNSNPEIRDELTAILDLDPMPYNTEDEKMVKLQNGGVTQQDYVISCNITTFVCQAAAENKGFYELELAQKREILNKYADAVIAANSSKQGIAVEPEEDIE